MDIDKIVKKAVMILARQGIQPSFVDKKIAYRTNEKPGGPWIYLEYSDHNCTYLRTFLYNCVSKQLPKAEQFIPMECQNCYKVVAKPTSLTDLMELKHIMEEMGFAGKCGIEKRESVDALYGGYWYCNNKEEGLLRLKQAKESLYGTGIPCFLKRGCTEYEQEFGPSNKWEVKPGQEELEKGVFKRVSLDNSKRSQTESDKLEIIKSWEAFAVEMGPEYVGSHNYITYGENK